MMFEFKKEILIKCNIEEIFDFHLNPQNINIISPPGLSAGIIEITDNPLKLASEIKLKVSQLGIKSVWHIKISELRYPEVICDEQISGFFNYWKHYHIFEASGDKVKMTDKVLIEPPLGFFGKIIYPFIYTGLLFMFTYRHVKTRGVFEK